MKKRNVVLRFASDFDTRPIGNIGSWSTQRIMGNVEGSWEVTMETIDTAHNRLRKNRRYWVHRSNDRIDQTRPVSVTYQLQRGEYDVRIDAFYFCIIKHLSLKIYS